MRIIDKKQIESLNISPKTCIEWVTESFLMKPESQLPAKVSVHPSGNDFITTMPCLLPDSYHTFGVKVVSRVQGRHPALKSELMLFDSMSGELKAILDADWITSMRTGAVAALAMKTFRKPDSFVYSFIGLGNTARATVKCMLELFKDEKFTIRLFRYKNQAEKFVEDFAECTGVSFEIVDTIEKLMWNTDVLVSCITDAQGLLVEDETLFKPGILVVPVHTRGFQNCDLFFDKVFADDTDHVKGFKNFSRFRSFNEIGNVLSGKVAGRESSEERILSYNIGLGLHDVYFSSRIYDQIYLGE